jgi:hypothetical protein
VDLGITLETLPADSENYRLPACHSSKTSCAWTGERGSTQSMPSIIRTSERIQNRCERKISPTLQTRMSSIAGMHEARNKLCPQLQQAAPWAGGPMANGLDQDPHLKPGKIMVTEDMGHKIEGHLAANAVGVDTTDGHLGTTTDRLHHHRAIADQTGATAPMRDRATSHHHLARVVIRYQTHRLAMVVQKEAIGDEVVLQLAMSTSQATMGQGGQENQMTDNDEGHATLETLEMDLQQTNGEIEVEVEVEITVTGTGSEATRGILEGSAEMPRHDLGVQNDGTGTVTTGTTTSIEGVSCYTR